jgi:flagellar hook-associated protein 1 FlgK
MSARALGVQQDAMSVAGNNLANVNNAAYSRQILNTTTAIPLDTTVGEQGNGVQEVSITQVRNSILDNQIQQEGSITGALNAEQTALQDAQGQLAEQVTSSTSAASTSPNGLEASINSFFSAMQSLSANPSDTSLRQTAIQSAQNLASQFNQTAAGLGSITSGLNSSIVTDTATANQDLTTIATLNNQIMIANAQGTTADDLVDQRQAAIEDLSSKVNLTATPQTNGSVTINIGNTDMVVGGKVTDSLAALNNGTGDIGLFETNNFQSLTVTGGSIGGDITARDGALFNIENSLDTLASQIVTQVNSVYSSGYDLNGNTGQSLFTGSNAATIGVNSNLTNNPSAFQAAGVAGASGDNTVALAVANLATKSIPGLGNGTFTSNYASNVTDLGNALSSVNEGLSNSTVVSQMLTQQRDSVSGVSTDQEMTNLLQFQKAYEASAEVITTLNEMMYTLINMKTE